MRQISRGGIRVFSDCCSRLLVTVKLRMTNDECRTAADTIESDHGVGGGFFEFGNERSALIVNATESRSGSTRRWCSAGPEFWLVQCGQEPAGTWNAEPASGAPIAITRNMAANARFTGSSLVKSRPSTGREDGYDDPSEHARKDSEPHQPPRYQQHPIGPGYS